MKTETNPNFATNNPIQESVNTQPLPMGPCREQGEGGFFAKILFQDTKYPWRYAFIQEYRYFDYTSTPPQVSFYGCFGDKNYDGSPAALPAGQISRWNISGGMPFEKIESYDQNLEQSDQNIPSGRVYQWCEEINKNQSVPVNTIVWMRGGPTYLDVDSGTLRQDFTFSYQYPIYAKITGQYQDSNGIYNSYAWTEVYRKKNEAGQIEWTDVVNPRCSDPSTGWEINAPIKNAAVEANGYTKVPEDQIVKLYPSQVIEYDAGVVKNQEWIFDYGIGQLRQFELIDKNIWPDEVFGGTTDCTKFQVHWVDTGDTDYVYSEDEDEDPVCLGVMRKPFTSGRTDYPGGKGYAKYISSLNKWLIVCGEFMTEMPAVIYDSTIAPTSPGLISLWWLGTTGLADTTHHVYAYNHSTTQATAGMKCHATYHVNERTWSFTIHREVREAKLTTPYFPILNTLQVVNIEFLDDATSSTAYCRDEDDKIREFGVGLNAYSTTIPATLVLVQWDKTNVRWNIIGGNFITTLEGKTLATIAAGGNGSCELNAPATYPAGTPMATVTANNDSDYEIPNGTKVVVVFDRWSRRYWIAAQLDGPNYWSRTVLGPINKLSVPPVVALRYL